VKLCVGADSVDDLAAWQTRVAARRRATGEDARPVHVTRMWPRQAEALLAGGSLYWVIKGVILVRQKIAALEAVTDAEGVRRCAIVLEPDLVRTEPRPRKPFQGWRYLAAKDAPPDLGAGARPGAAGEDALPPELECELALLGLGRG
jgi:hypothetical protein